jgi:hypothetical protein
MSTISLPKTLSNGTIANADDVMSNLNTIVTDYNGGITNANISGSAAIGLTKLANSVDWTNYASSSTIVGWSSFSYKNIYYKKIEKTVFVMVCLDGTSNDTVATFTLPYSMDSGGSLYMYTTNYAINAGGTAAAGSMIIYAGENLVHCYPTVQPTVWSNINEKIVAGQFFYQSA